MSGGQGGRDRQAVFQGCQSRGVPPEQRKSLRRYSGVPLLSLKSISFQSSQLRKKLHFQSCGETQHCETHFHPPLSLFNISSVQGGMFLRVWRPLFPGRIMQRRRKREGGRGRKGEPRKGGRRSDQKERNEELTDADCHLHACACTQAQSQWMEQQFWMNLFQECVRVRQRSAGTSDVQAWALWAG